MANIKTLIEEWSVKDLEDNSAIRVIVESCTELGNDGKPGIQVFYMGNYVTLEPNIVEQWAYKAGKANVTEYLLEDRSWMAHTDQYVKIFLVLGSPLKAKVEVKTRSSKPTVKEYPLPFEV
jgi:ABC-type taurine transport system substrate-binding protein